MLYGMANNNVTIPAERDGALYNFLLGNQDYIFDGIGDEFEIVPSSSSFVITLGEGEGVICGRHVTEQETTGAYSMITLEANANGYIVIRVDLSRPAGTEAYLAATPNPAQGDLNNGENVRDLPLYRYSTNATGVSSFIDVRNISKGSNVVCELLNGVLYVYYYNNGTVTRKQVGSLDPDTLTATPEDVKSGKTFGGAGSDEPLTGTFLGQTKNATPSTTQQTVTPDAGKYLSSVTVAAMPSTFKFASVVNGQPLGKRTSSTIDAGDNTARKYFITAHNGSYGIDGSNDGNNWTNNIVSDSTPGSSSSYSSENTETKNGNISGYRYYRAWIEPYNNGSRGTIGLAIGF